MLSLAEIFFGGALQATFQLGGVRLEEPIGRGGMGQVWRARPNPTPKPGFAQKNPQLENLLCPLPPLC